MSGAPLRLFQSPATDPALALPAPPAAPPAAEMSERCRQVMAQRARVCEECLAAIHAAAERTRSAAIDAFAADARARYPELSLSGRTLRRWLRAYQADGASGLLDRRAQRSGRDAAQCDPGLWDEFLGLYLSGRRSARLCWEIVAAIAQRDRRHWLTESQCRTRLAAIPPAVQVYHREGERAWSSRYAPRTQRDYASYRPLETWVGDHHTFDLVARWQIGGREVRGRPVLTAWMDMASRACVGFRIVASPSSDSILGAFADGVHRHGPPRGICVDNGRDYRSASFAGGRKTERLSDRLNDTVLDSLGVSAQWTLAYSPESKGQIERWFRTVCDRFAAWFPSYLGGTPQARPEGVHKAIRADKVPIPTLDELRDLFARWLSVDYHARPHGGHGMDGRSPAQVLSDSPVARRTVPRIAVGVDPDGVEITHLDLLLMRPLRCVVGKWGVRVRGLYYGAAHPALYPAWSRREVCVRVPEDGRFVVVCDDAGRVICVAPQATLIAAGGAVSQDMIRTAVADRRRAVKQMRRLGDVFRRASDPLISRVLAARPAPQSVDAPPRNVALLPIAGPGTSARPARPAAPIEDPLLDDDSLALTYQPAPPDDDPLLEEV